MVFKTIHGLTPSYMSDFVTVTSNQCYDLRSNTSNQISHKCAPKTEVLKRSFSFTGMEYWNAVPSQIRNITNISTFKHSLKNYLMSSNE